MPTDVERDKRELDSYREKCLRWTARCAWYNTHYWHDEFRKMGWTPDDMQNFSMKHHYKIPVLTRKIARANQDLGAGVFRLSTISPEEAYLVATECGTHADPVIYMKSNDDRWQWMYKQVPRIYHAAGLVQQERVGVVFPFVAAKVNIAGREVITKALAGRTFEDGLLATGCIPARREYSLEGAEGEKKVTVLTGHSSRINKYAEAMLDNDNDPAGLGIKKLVVNGEPYGVFEGHLAELFNVERNQVYNFEAEAGSLATAYECKVHNGWHVNPSVLVEVTDTDTGEVLEPGKTGDITLTTLAEPGFLPGMVHFRRATPYKRTKRLYEQKCECGRVTERISPIQTINEKRPMISVVALEPKYFMQRAAANHLADLISLKGMHSEVRRTPTPGRRVAERMEEAIVFEVEPKNGVTPEQQDFIKGKLTEVDMFLKVVYKMNLGTIDFNGLSSHDGEKKSNGATAENGG